MKAIQLSIAVALVAAVLIFVLGGGPASITDQITTGQDTTEDVSTELHDAIQTQKEDLSKRMHDLRFPESKE